MLPGAFEKIDFDLASDLDDDDDTLLEVCVCEDDDWGVFWAWLAGGVWYICCCCCRIWFW